MSTEEQENKERAKGVLKNFSSATLPDPTTHPLPGALEVAVPLWMVQLYEVDADARSRLIEAWCSDAADVLERNGEAILYCTTSGKSAESFNALARALAALSFMPGGVTLFGRHWQSTP